MTRLLCGFLFLLFLISTQSSAQQRIQITGFVNDTAGHPLPGVNLWADTVNTGTTTNSSGHYILIVPTKENYFLRVSSVGYQTIKQTIARNGENELHLHFVMKEKISTLQEVSVTAADERGTGLQKMNIHDFGKLPNPGGNIEALIITLPGVSSTNELSSQYSVRGGNFDENLVYVNDIEIIRPFLIRSGQQEGLSFINPQMVSSVNFSTGGFEARYGDKMSSVLDVSYRQPRDHQIQGSISLLGGSLTGESINKHHTFSQITGIRYKTSQYLLSTFDTKGEYRPAFADIQTLMTWHPAGKFEFSFLGNYSQNRYRFTPATRSTNFGTTDNLYNLTVYYDGKESDNYRSMLGAFTTTFRPGENFEMKFILSGYSTAENESFDIEGQYLINELDQTAGSHSYNDSLLNIGIGGMLQHARNHLWIDAYTASWNGLWEHKLHTLRWSFQVKNQEITDRLNEWTYLDSAGYSVPTTDKTIVLNDYANTNNNMTDYRYSGFVQDAFRIINNRSKWWLNAGIRYHYWTFNKEWLWSPRIRLSFQPGTKRQVLWYAAWGKYDQPPVYREMRNFQGRINPGIKSQKSTHYVIGNEYNLQIWSRPFKLTTEIYYKDLTNLIPYRLNSLQIKYTAQNNAVGYATGLDMKLNGEFVPGLQSWLSFSLLKTEENILNDYYIGPNGQRIEPGYYPRPTDQRFNFNLFFQDFLPNHPTLQMHLNFVYGSSLPASPPGSKRFDLTFPIGPYRRVDIGFSKMFKQENSTAVIPWFKNFKECSATLEVFNLLDMNNKASFLWIRTISNQNHQVNELAVPNYLTSRRINLKFSFTL